MEAIMTKRLNILVQKNAGIEGLVAVETWLVKSLDPKLLELVKVRVSQMNGCAHCLHMHRQDALKQGETGDRLLLLSAWRESGLSGTPAGQQAERRSRLVRSPDFSQTAPQGGTDKTDRTASGHPLAIATLPSLMPKS